jgi:tetratricopeptide (TPR) repeat protein
VNDQRSLEERLRRIAELPVDPASRLLLAAAAYVQGGLYADAIANYDAALQAQEMPEARVALGGLYLKIGLTTLAGREYGKVLAGAPDCAMRAEAELGLGYASYFRKRYDDARGHFECARDLYVTLGMSEEAESARKAAALVPL